MEFPGNPKNLELAARNQRPPQMPMYEHLINAPFMAQVLGEAFPDPFACDASDRRRYYDLLCEFYRRMTYDAVSFEVCVTGLLPGSGALLGESAGPIQNREDFEH